MMKKEAVYTFWLLMTIYTESGHSKEIGFSYPQDEQKLSKYDDRYVIVNYDLSPAGNCWKQTWLLKQIQENRQEIRHLNKILQNTNCKALH